MLIAPPARRVAPGPTPRRDAVAQAAAEVIAERGLAAASLREIATRLGTSIGVLTHQFRDRDQLILYAFDTISADLTARATAAMRGRTPRSAIARGLSLALPLDRGRRVDAAMWLAFATAASTSPDLAAAYAARHEDWVRGLEALVSALPGPPARPAADTAELLLAATDGIAVRALASGGHLSARRQRALLAAAVDALLDEPVPTAASSR